MVESLETQCKVISAHNHPSMPQELKVMDTRFLCFLPWPQDSLNHQELANDFTGHYHSEPNLCSLDLLIVTSKEGLKYKNEKSNCIMIDCRFTMVRII